MKVSKSLLNLSFFRQHLLVLFLPKDDYDAHDDDDDDDDALLLFSPLLLSSSSHPHFL